jgi:hypothetical protein
VSIFDAAAGRLYIPAEAGTRPGNFVALLNPPKPWEQPWEHCLIFRLVGIAGHAHRNGPMF